MIDLAKLKLQVSIMVVLLSAFQVASPSYSSLHLSGEAIIWNHRVLKYRRADWQRKPQPQPQPPTTTTKKNTLLYVIDDDI